MNIDIIEQSGHIRVGSSHKISAIKYGEGNLYVGFANGDLSIYNASKSLAKGKEQPVQPPKLGRRRSTSTNHSGSDSIDEDNITFDITFKNISKENTPITRIETLDLGSDTNKSYLIVAGVSAFRVYERVGGHLNLILELEEVRNYVDFVFVSSERLLVVALKSKIVVYKIVNKSRNILQILKQGEAVLKDRIQALSPVRHESKLLVGLLSDFQLFDIFTHELTPLVQSEEKALALLAHSSSFNYFGISTSAPSTRIISLGPTLNQLLILKDTRSVTYNLESAVLEVSPIRFVQAPLYVSYIYPSYLLVVYQKKIEIVDYESGNSVQRLETSGNNLIAINSDHGCAYRVYGNEVYSYRQLPIQRQIDQYLSISGRDTTRTKNLKDSMSDLRVLGLERAITLVSKLSDNDEYFHSEGENDPKKTKQLKIRDLYKAKAILLFGSYSKFHESLVNISIEWLVSYHDILNLFPNFLNAELQIQDENPPPLNHMSSYSLIKKVKVEELKVKRTSKLIETIPENDTQTIKSAKSSKSAKSTFGLDSTTMTKFTKAVNNLIVYLTEQRRVLTNFMNDKENPHFHWKGIEITPTDIYPGADDKNYKKLLDYVSEIIDTSLFLCYFHTRPMLLGPLLRLPNNKCNAKVVNRNLLSNLHDHDGTVSIFIKELLDFYFGRGLHKDALEMLFKLSHDEDIHNDFEEYLQGPDLTIQYLQKLSNKDLELIFQFSVWVLTEFRDDQLKYGEFIYMNDSFECEGYDQYRVLDFFVEVVKSDPLAIRYLEWLLFESDIALERKISTKFHTKLCLFYLKQIGGPESKYYYDKVYRFLETTDSYEPWTILRHISSDDDRLLRLTVFVHKKLGEHEKSIDVLYNQLDDLDAAIDYCVDMYINHHNEDLGRTLLHKLLEDLLVQPSQNADQVQKLLELQGPKMSLTKVLASLPEEFPMRRLANYLSQGLRENFTSLQESRMESQLYKVGVVKLQDELLTARDQGYYLESSMQLCPICHKRLGYSVFAIDKNNNVVHYTCNSHNV